MKLAAILLTLALAGPVFAQDKPVDIADLKKDLQIMELRKQVLELTYKNLQIAIQAMKAKINQAEKAKAKEKK